MLGYLRSTTGHGASPALLRFTAAYSAPSSLLYAIFIKPIYILRSILTFAGPIFHSRRSKSKPLIFNFMRALRSDPGTADLKIGVAGFCWGGQYAVLLAQDDPAPLGSTESKPLVDAAFTAHPALLSIPADIVKVKAPLSIAVAEHDMYLKPPAVERLKSVEKGEEYEVVMFPGTGHGFAMRNNPKDGVQMAAAEKAEGQALVWFKRWLG
jgi:dienelactone hydrolase